jgi:type VI secretion system protein ImpJ
MHLSQHHFQAQTRYFEELTTFALRSVAYAPWGLAARELDAEALLNGTVAVVHARGIMPDGLCFAFPEEPPPAARNVRDVFSPTQDAQLVYLAVPAYAPGAANAGPAQRFVTATLTVSDDVGDEARDVGIARGNFRLLLEGEPQDGLAVLPLARVRRDGAGHFVYDTAYVAPSLRIGASARLLDMLQRLIEIMQARADTLRAERAAATSTNGAGGSDYATREVAAFWLSHALHSSLPGLAALLAARDAHPERLFTELSRLAGSLCTFALGSHPRTLPLYDHGSPGAAFDELERHIVEHLELVQPTRVVTVPLQLTEDCYYVAAVADERCYGAPRWLLGLRSPVGAAELSGRVPRLVKVCSAQHIAKLVARAYPALELQPVLAPPPSVAPRPDTQYFDVSRSGPCWDLICQTHEVGVYVPAAIPDVEVELCIALQE